MKLIRIGAIVLISLVLSSCSVDIGKDPVEPAVQQQDSVEITPATQEIPAHQNLLKTYAERSVLDANEGMTIDVPEVGLYGLVVRRKEKGYLTSSSSFPTAVYILGDYRYDRSACHDSYLAVEVEGKVLFFDFKNNCDDDLLYLCDVDGDGLDEIVVQQVFAPSGGAGSYESHVFKVVDDDICEIFDSLIVDPSDNSWSYFDTGFSGVQQDGFKEVISNKMTGYEITLDYSSESRYRGRIFDDNGKVIEGFDIHCGSFYQFIPEDIDGDGIYEIVCLQYVSITDETDWIGDAKSILKFNPDSQRFEVVQAEFIPRKQAAMD